MFGTVAYLWNFEPLQDSINSPIELQKIENYQLNLLKLFLWTLPEKRENNKFE